MPIKDMGDHRRRSRVGRWEVSLLTCGVISPHVIIEVMESHLDKREVSYWQAELGGGLVKLNT